MRWKEREAPAAPQQTFTFSRTPEGRARPSARPPLSQPFFQMKAIYGGIVPFRPLDAAEHRT